MKHYLEFEKPVAELENKIEELRHLSGDDELNIADEVGRMQAKAERQLKTLYAKLTPWQKCLVARHPERPHVKDYIESLVEDFMPLAGDRLYGEDKAIVGGFGRFNGRTVVVMGQEKGSDTNSRVAHNFGMARPEGYRKAQRLMQLAQRFGVPLLTLVDTAGAYPGVGAEERGQAEAIARCMDISLQLDVPLVSVIVGEGGSGGAIALATTDEVLMLEHAIYSVISPEGCASILWRSSEQAQEAAEALKLTAQDLKALAVIDAIVPEPLGGAHRGREETIAAVGEAVEAALQRLEGQDAVSLRRNRRQKYLDMGQKGLS
ncbi:acetyl-CoA carboxylase carboxyltransferase subunit alpha [Aquibaculum arenosum]|uniref:Acetyl-coenzyme A carboxylase carboxyl transferase subunit alpha n=1 Tax=Aquibaculum arenosum TaxID=3032591 RepID=A0ABT5YM66_9PROT|nr:acetyl-CoA carboxylase carboxyltransferase subunit alpha [Fodinicurvata sp. CAU 1616]MDF2096051.1 acetyl-CoA carboxylase carboxyltransferase subunit alpha [Fodinicurvata sp. CAU 1616]